jgi:hypothetical protein
MSWNYRVVELEGAEGGKYYEVKEVFYNRDGKPVGYCDATVSGDSFDEIVSVIGMMSKDVHKSVLREEDFYRPLPTDKDAE